MRRFLGLLFALLVSCQWVEREQAKQNTRAADENQAQFPGGDAGYRAFLKEQGREPPAGEKAHVFVEFRVEADLSLIHI